MKKHFIGIVLACLIFSGMSVGADNISVSVNGKVLNISQSPIIIENEVFIPLRAVLEPMNIKMFWDNSVKGVTVDNKGSYTTIYNNSNIINIDNTSIALAKAPVIIDDSFYVPIQAIANILGSNVNWNSKDSVVEIIADTTNSVIPVTKKSKAVYVKAEDGSVLIKCYIDYPQFEGIDKINEHLEAMAEEYIDNCSKNVSAEDLKESYENELAGITYENGTTYDIKKNDGKVLSILNTQVVYTGGAHPNSYRFSDNIDVATGEVLHAEEMLGITSDELDEIVRKEFVKLIKADSSAFFDTAEQDLDKLIGAIGYYYNEEGVVFYIPPYEIAPYARGFVEITIPYTK